MKLRELEKEIVLIAQSVESKIPVFDYDKIDHAPAVTVNYISFSQRRMTFEKREVTYTFHVNLYYPINEGPNARASFDALKELIERYGDAFLKDRNLNGKARSTEVTEGELDVLLDVKNPVYVHTFILQAIAEEER